MMDSLTNLNMRELQQYMQSRVHDIEGRWGEQGTDDTGGRAGINDTYMTNSKYSMQMADQSKYTAQQSTIENARYHVDAFGSRVHTCVWLSQPGDVSCVWLFQPGDACLHVFSCFSLLIYNNSNYG